MEGVKRVIKLRLVKYLESNGELGKLEARVGEFAEKLVSGQTDLHQTFYFPFRLNVIDLGQDMVLDFLIKEPGIVQVIAEEIALTALGLALRSHKRLQLAQIVSPVIVAPPFPLSGAYLEPGLTSFIGVVIECTELEKFIRTSRWKCKETCCLTKDPQVVKALPKTRPICKSCAAPLEEVPAFRDHGNRWRLKLASAGSLSLQLKSINKCIEACVEDERNLDGVLRLGDEVAVSGVYDEMLDVWGLQHIFRKPSGLLASSTLERMRNQLQDSPWAFVKVLAVSLGRSFLPDGMFKQLRIGLILSLASVHFEPPIPILAVCDDDDPVQLLMREALSLTERCTRPLIDRSLSGFFSNGWMQAGPLQLASRGVCFLGHWEPYSGKKGQAARDAVSSGRISLTGGTHFEPLRCAIWTYLPKPKRKNLNQLETLFKIFGMVWRAESELDVVEDSADLILGLTSSQELIPLNEVRLYLRSIVANPVELTECATELLKHYFTCSRLARNGTLPLTSLDPLRALTEAHARVNGRPLAYPEDALAAIELCEKALGPIPGFPPTPEETWEFGSWLKDNILAISNQKY